MKKAIYKLILFIAITAFVLSLSPTVTAEPNDTDTTQIQSVAPETKPIYNPHNPEPAPRKESATDKRNFQLQLAKEQLRGDFYKDAADRQGAALWALIGVVITIAISVIGVIVYLLFTDRKGYERALIRSENAAEQAEKVRDRTELLEQRAQAVLENMGRDAAKNARDLEKEAQGVLVDIKKQAKTMLEEIDTKANDKRKNIDKLVADKLEEIEKTSKKREDESSIEFNRQLEVSKRFNNAMKADEAKDHETASDYYKQIVEELKEENSPDVYNNWGSALLKLAKSKKSTETERLFNLAFEKYQKAVKIKPNYPFAYNNWGTALLRLAISKKGTEAVKLLNQAIEKYQKAIEIKPDYYEAYQGWGDALSWLARNKKGEEREELFNQAIEKFKKALTIKPNFCDAYDGWGTALSEIARNKQGTEAEELLNQAFEKYKKATDIKQDCYEAYDNWSVALLDMARLKGGEDAEGLLNQAEEKCLKAESIKIGGGSYNLACVYALRGNEDKCKEWLKIGEKAGMRSSREHAMADDDLKSVRDKEWFKSLRWKGE